jgi:hypothetical protein
MRVSDARRVVFVHVPKTGGCTIDLLFDREVADARKVTGAGRHAPYGRLLKVDPTIDDYWSFGFVRDPWARLVSYWSMLRDFYARVEAGKPEALRKLAEVPAVWAVEGEYRHDFRRFVVEGTAAIPKAGRPQVATLSAGARRVDFVGRVETFDRDLAIVRERLGLPPLPRVPRLNKSSHGDYHEYYTDETRDHVAKIFADDIAAFGYTF